MVNSYVLVNPHIEGSFKRKIKAQNSNEASNIFYKNISEHFNNSVPSFNFTIHKGSSGNGKFYHFQVKESRKNKEVTFSINPLTLQGEEKSIERFKKNLENFKSKFNQSGGKDKKSKKHKKNKKHKDDDSSSSSSSDSEIYIKTRNNYNLTQPIYYWWYDPYLYNMDHLYIPTFYSYVTPYIELNLSGFNF